MKRFISYLLSITFLFLTGCGAPTVGDVGAVRQFFAMDTPMQISAFGDNQEEAVDAVQAEINRLEKLLSRTRADSQISNLNRHAGDGIPTQLDREVVSLLTLAQGYTEETDGAFDITIAPVMDAWGFGQDANRVPTQSELDRLLPLVDSRKLILDGNTAQLSDPHMAVDLGAIAKGYAAGRAADILRSYDVDAALLSLGGNITALGTHANGDPWQVAVRDPKNTDGYLCILPLKDTTASTSGGYERYFEQDGKTYHHIIDPSTGSPANTGLLSVTVISPDAALDDALSTALFVMGPDKALEFWRNRDGFDLILVKTDGTVLITEGLEQGLEFRGERNGYTYEIVRR